MPKIFYTLLLASLVTFRAAPSLASEADQKFNTRYTTIYYSQQKDLKAFLWRISGKRIDIHVYPGLAQSRVDRIVEKVQATLDMYPRKFHVDIYIKQKYEKGEIAFYSEKDNSVTVYANKVTDGVLAHEIAHAVIKAYFRVPPPQKVREILSQYVDRHFY